MASKPPRLVKLLRTYSQWLYLPDPGTVEITLATVAANRIPGDPVWLMLTGPPSSGKTEILNSLLILPHMYSAATMTEAGLLSGSSRKDTVPGATGGLLAEIKGFGIIVLKDFTSILSMNRDKLRALLAALREVYDGSWTRAIGADGGRTLEWKGKIGLIGGVTSAIDSQHSVMSAMGQRFAQYRLPKTDAELQARRAIEKTGSEEEMRAELSAAVLEFFSGIDFDSPPALLAPDRDWIVALTTLVATCRSAVERDGYSREIELIHDPEAPARLTRMLVQLLRGLQLVGANARRQRELIVKVGFDCIPPVRRLALEALLTRTITMTLAEIATATGYPNQTVRRALEDLSCHGIVEDCSPNSNVGRWCVAPEWKQRFEMARGTFPKCH